jgi:folate-dependent phosphoribosylglycinamide formyltransferase PurN
MKIGLMTSYSLTDYQFHAVKRLLGKEDLCISFVLFDNRPRKSFMEKFIKNFKRGRGGYMIVMFLQKYFGKSRVSYKMIQFCDDHKITYFESENPYSENTLQQLKMADLDLIVLLGGFGIIKLDILKIPKLGVISYHHGNMRKYRGMPPAFWELYNGEKEMGITVQQLSTGLDRGLPIVEKVIPIRKRDTWNSLKNRALEEGVEMLEIAIDRLRDHQFQLKPIEKVGNVYTLPNLRQWIFLYIKIVLRKVL